MHTRINLDTGMHRLGFAPEEIPALVDRLHRQSAVIPRSVFSHLVGSDAERFELLVLSMNVPEAVSFEEEL